MSLFSTTKTKKKRKPWKMPTGEMAKRINSVISKMRTSAGEMDLADTPKKYYTASEKMGYHVHMLSVYEDEGYIVDTSGTLAKYRNEYDSIKSECEHDFIIRAHRRMQREANELKTDKAKYNKALKFYQEFDIYHPQMYYKNVQFVEQLKSQDKILKNYSERETVKAKPTVKRSNYCPMCGTKAPQGAAFCGECGYKL